MTKLDTIRKSGICLHSHWAHAYEIIRLAEKLGTTVSPRSIVPSTAVVALEEAFQRASDVLAFNAKRQARLAALRRAS